MSPSPSVNELFIRYLEFLKEIGVRDISISSGSKNLLNESAPKKLLRQDEPPERKSSVSASSGPPVSKAVGLSLWSGPSVSPLVCVCEKLSDEVWQRNADQKLNDIIEKGMSLKAEDVPICRVEFFTLAGETSESFASGLRSKIISASPTVILAMGEVASSFLLNRKKVDLSRERGVWGEFEGVKVMPTYHPGYLVKNYTVRVRRDVFNDIKKVKEKLTGNCWTQGE